MELIGYFFSSLIGVSLGLIGGGGSMLTVPILVYIFAVNPDVSTSYSLFIVGLTAAVGAIRNYQKQLIDIKTGLLFAITSLFSLLLTRKFFMPLIPQHLFNIGDLQIGKNLLIMVVFAFLMIASSFSMIRKKQNTATTNEYNFYKMTLIGLGLGFISGFLGAGGGFLIIPALVFFANLPMKKAIGTSLFIIAFNSLFGFGADLLNGVKIEFQLLIGVAFAAILGMFLGIYLSKNISGDKLKPAFGWFVLAMGIYVMFKEIVLK